MASVLTIRDAPNDREGTAMIRLCVTEAEQQPFWPSHCHQCFRQVLIELVETIHGVQRESSSIRCFAMVWESGRQ